MKNTFHILIIFACRFHKELLEHHHPNWNGRRIQLEQHKNFIQWFRDYIDELRLQKELAEEVISLAQGPINEVVSYPAYFVNGYKFETEAVQNAHITQNSGVATISDDNSLYYGVLKKIIEIKYMFIPSKYLFKCIWYDMKEGRGVQIDEYKLISVIVTRTSFDDEPFIFPTHAQHVYYPKSPVKKDWSVVCRWKPRDTYEVPLASSSQEEITSIEEEEDAILVRNLEPTIPMEGIPNGDSDVLWVREEISSDIEVDVEEIESTMKSSNDECMLL